MKRCRFSLASIAKMFVMPAQKELVGHAGDVIANDDVACFHLREFFIGSRHRAVRSQIVGEKLLETVHGAFAVLGNDRMVVDMCEEDAFERLVEQEFGARTAMRAIDFRVDFTKKRNFPAQNGKVEELGFEGIVNIRGVVGNFVDPVDELRFNGRAQIEKVFLELRKFRGGIIARILDDSFANLKRKIQPRKIEIALLELFHDAKRVHIVTEMAAAGEHQFIQFFFAGMAKGGMTDVMDESQGLRELGVQTQGAGDGAGDLRDFEGVRQAVAKMVGIARGEYLGFGFESAEGPGMNNSIAVASVATAVRVSGFRIAPAAGLFRSHCPGSRSGNGFDGPLRYVAADPRKYPSAEQVRILAKVDPGRGRPDPRWWCLEIPS